MPRYTHKIRKHRLLSPALVDTMRRVFTALRRERIHFAVIGAVALGARGHRRFTEDVDLLVDPEKWQKATAALSRIGIRHARGGHHDSYLMQLQDEHTGARVDLLFGVGDPEESARETATDALAEGLKARTARAEYLVWLYLLSDRVQHMADAVELIAKKKVDLRKLQDILRVAGVERELFPRLREWVIRAKMQNASSRRKPTRTCSKTEI